MISKIEISNDTDTLEMGTGTKFGILPEIEGLESPDVRTSSLVFSGRHGGKVTNQLYGLRVLSIKGTIKPDNVDEHYELRQALLTILNISQRLKIRIHLDDGRILMQYARTDKPVMPITHKKYTDFFFNLTCDDYMFYEDSGGDYSSILVNRKTNGGAEWSLVWPVVWGASVGGVTATNTGSTPSYPIIYIYGIVHNPIVTNVTTGDRIELDITTSSADDVIVIDTRENTATLNGGNIYPLIAEPRDFMSIETGDNLIEFDTSNSGDTGHVEVRWYSTYEGA